MTKVNKLLLILFFTVMPFIVSKGQDVAIKSNLLYDLTTTINLGVEAGLNDKWTLDLSGNYNPWTFSNNKKWKHWLVQPEVKYWFCEKFNGSSLGAHLLGGQGNVGNVDIPINFLGTDFRVFRNHRYEGWFVGGGIAYNYSWMLGDRWNLEAGVGVGYIRFDYDKYECATCGSWVRQGVKDYFGFTKLAVNIVYIIK